MRNPTPGGPFARCLPRSPAPTAEVIARYRLRPHNVLVPRDDAASYFVLQVDARRNRALEDFDHAGARRRGAVP